MSNDSEFVKLLQRLKDTHVDEVASLQARFDRLQEEMNRFRAAFPGSFHPIAAIPQSSPFNEINLADDIPRHISFEPRSDKNPAREDALEDDASEEVGQQLIPDGHPLSPRSKNANLISFSDYNSVTRRRVPSMQPAASSSSNQRRPASPKSERATTTSFDTVETCHITSEGSSQSLNDKREKRLSHFLQGPPAVSDFLVTDEINKIQRARQWVRSMMANPWFEVLFAMIILLNAFVMGAAVQYEGLEVGYTLGFKNRSEPASETWPHAKDVLDVLEWIFGSLYALELALNVFGSPKKFWKSMWNWLDTVVVLCFVMEKLFENAIPVKSQLIRCFRLARVVRLVRFVRIIEGFDALFLMMTAIRGSFIVLIWAFMLLFIVHLIVGLLISQILFTSYFDETAPVGPIQLEVYEYFGTMSRSILSTFELTFANWPPICRLLTENVSEWFSLYVVIHKLTLGFAVIGVINGVFMQETLNVASSDNTIMLRRKEKETSRHFKKMSDFFRSLDTSQDGYVSIDEFQAIATDSEVKLWLSSMDLAADDLEVLFRLLDLDGDGKITQDELVRGVSRLRGPARSIDLVTMFRLQQDLLQISHKSHRLQKEVHSMTTTTKNALFSASGSELSSKRESELDSKRSV